MGGSEAGNRRADSESLFSPAGLDLQPINSRGVDWHAAC